MGDEQLETVMGMTHGVGSRHGRWDDGAVRGLTKGAYAGKPCESGAESPYQDQEAHRLFPPEGDPHVHHSNHGAHRSACSPAPAP